MRSPRLLLPAAGAVLLAGLLPSPASPAGCADAAAAARPAVTPHERGLAPARAHFLPAALDRGEPGGMRSPEALPTPPAPGCGGRPAGRPAPLPRVRRHRRAAPGPG